MHEITEKIKSELWKAFDEATRYVAVKDQKVSDMAMRREKISWTLSDLSFSQPSLKFEEQNRIQGVSYQYILPSGLLPRELNEYVLFASLTDRGVYKRLNEVWEQLKKDNEKTLGSLKFDTNDTRQLYNAILGVASAFLPQDIQFYLDGGRNSTLLENHETKFLLNKIETRFSKICWVPGTDTLHLIDRQIDEKRNSAATSMTGFSSPQR